MEGTKVSLEEILFDCLPQVKEINFRSILFLDITLTNGKSEIHVKGISLK